MSEAPEFKDDPRGHLETHGYWLIGGPPDISLADFHDSIHEGGMSRLPVVPVGGPKLTITNMPESQ